MTHSSHNKLVSFIWSIADDCLRDVYVRGKYRDIILPFVVLRRIDALLEPTKAEVLEEVRFQKEDLNIVSLLRQVIGELEEKISEANLNIVTKWPEERIILYFSFDVFVIFKFVPSTSTTRFVYIIVVPTRPSGPSRIG